MNSPYTSRTWPREMVAGTGKLRVDSMRAFKVRFSTDPSGIKSIMNVNELRQQLEQDGYLYLKSVIPAQCIEQAKYEIWSYLKKLGFCADDVECEGIIPASLQGPNHDNVHVPQRTISSPNLMKDQEWISKTPELKSALEYSDLALIVQALSSRTAIHAGCLPFKWLRAVGTGLYTGLHADRKYINDIHPDLLTFWIPLDFIPSEKGGLIVCPGSHSDSQWSSIRTTYLKDSKLGKDGTESGWLAHDPISFLSNTTIDPESVNWVSADFEPGDACLFGQDVFHISGTNTTQYWRLSCDTRWLPFTKDDSTT